MSKMPRCKSFLLQNVAKEVSLAVMLIVSRNLWTIVLKMLIIFNRLIGISNNYFCIILQILWNINDIYFTSRWTLHWKTYTILKYIIKRYCYIFLRRIRGNCINGNRLYHPWAFIFPNICRSVNVLSVYFPLLCGHM